MYPGSHVIAVPLWFNLVGQSLSKHSKTTQMRLPEVCMKNRNQVIEMRASSTPAFCQRLSSDA